MGTRNLSKVIYNGETVVAQYGQWDGYPAGQGITTFYTVKDEATIAGLQENLSKVYYPSSDELNALSKPFEDGSIPGMMSWDSGKRFSEQYPSLTRDTCSEIFRLIANATEPVPLVLDIEFENDELFCEGVYTINLDNKTFISKYGDKEVVLSFDEVRAMTPEDYLAKFHDEATVDYLSNELAFLNHS